MDRSAIILLVKNMKAPRRESQMILNYLLLKNWFFPISRRYKLHMKTLGCNARCPTCEEWQQEDSKSLIRANLYRAFRDILNDPVQYKHIQILGGEPLLIFNDINKIISIGSHHGITFDFPTNASLLTKNRIDALMTSWLHKFTFSLDFPDEYHDQWRGLPGAYQKIVSFTQYIQSKGGMVQWNTVVGTFNKDLLPGFQALYRHAAPNVHNYIPVTTYGDIPERFALSSENRKQVLLQIEASALSNIQTITDALKDPHSQNRHCFVPIDLVSYKITSDYVHINPCYYSEGRDFSKISSFSPSEIRDFAVKSATVGCTLCNADCKNETNNYMRFLIRKYALSSI